MNVTAPVDRQHDGIAVPEPNMTPPRLIERAIALRQTRREQQDEADEQGTYGKRVQEAFRNAGFYRVTQPRMFGRHEFDPGTDDQLIVEIARGHPGAGWCLSLRGSHAYVVGSHGAERAPWKLLGRATAFRGL